jgi:DNA-binding NtrC family response regulator
LNVPVYLSERPDLQQTIQQEIDELHRTYLEDVDLEALSRRFLQSILKLLSGQRGLLMLFPDRSAPSRFFRCFEPPSDNYDEKTVKAAESIAVQQLTSGPNIFKDLLHEEVQLANAWSGKQKCFTRVFTIADGSRSFGIVFCVAEIRSGLESEIELLCRHFICLAGRVGFSSWSASRGFSGLLAGKSEALLKTELVVKKVAVSTCPVLIQGETGSGKEMIAQLIHYYSPRRAGPFVAVNCGAFTSDDLLAAELFGHVRGAFTDAKMSRKGKVELAQGGTLFLDEVGCMRPSMQITLLRTLRYGEIQKVGDDRERVQVDVRIVTASNLPLKELVAKGQFRQDVYSRLRVATINVPPLRERQEDIPLLVQYYLARYCKQNEISPKSMTKAGLQVLSRYRWPDNIAGLQNAVLAACLLSDQEIDAADLTAYLHSDYSKELPSWSDPDVQPIQSLAEAKAEFERHYVWKVLQSAAGNRSEAAKILGISRQGLQKLIRRHQQNESNPVEFNDGTPAAADWNER